MASRGVHRCDVTPDQDEVGRGVRAGGRGGVRPTGDDGHRVGLRLRGRRQGETRRRAPREARRPSANAAQSGGSIWYMSSVWMPARRLRNAWIPYQTIPMMKTITTNVTPELLRYARACWPPEIALTIGPTPANQ